MRLSIALAAALFASCSADLEQEPAAAPEASVGQSIVGGALDPNDPSVVLLARKAGNDSSICTGSVVSKHVLLTAAHCVMPAPAGTTVTYYVFLGSDLNNSTQSGNPSNWLEVVETHYDPYFNINDLGNGHDVAVAIVRTPFAVPALPMNRTTLSTAYIGQPVRLVGYGLDSPYDTAGTSSGTKRQVTTPLSDVTSDTKFLVAGNAQKSTCRGDSGGPAFMTVGGKEVIAGITSFYFTGSGQPECSTSAYTRVDTYGAPYADKYIALWDGGGRNPLCPASGTATVCGPSGLLAHCANGGVQSWDDCTAKEAYCSIAGATSTTARCVSKSCVASATEVPKASATCGVQPGTVVKCDTNGQLTSQPCAAGQQCSSVGGAHCVKAVCPTTGSTLVCGDAQTVTECTSGVITKTTACATAEWCSVAGGQNAHCLSQECVATADTTPTAHATCLADGRYARCDAKGLLSVVSECAAGAVCVKSSSGASCVMAGPDAGTPDAPDAAVTATPDPSGAGAQEPSKCGCGTTGSSAPAFALLFGLLALVPRRLRR